MEIRKNKEESLVKQSDALVESYRRFNSSLKTDWGLPGADFGIHDFNLVFGGIQRKKSTVIAARSGMGKTAIIMPIIIGGNRLLSNKRARFIFFSWEMTSDFIADRMISNRVGITNTMLTQASKILSPDKINEINTVYRDLSKLDIVYHENSTSIEYVRDIYGKFCEETMGISKETGEDIIPTAIIDYIGMAKFDDGLRAYQVGDFMNGIKKMVNMEGGHAISLAQINRTADSKDLPDRSDLKDSADIENAADGLVILHRPEYLGNLSFPDGTDAKGKVMARFQKNRGGAIGDIILNCDIRYNRFWNIEHEINTPYWDLYKSKKFWLDHFGLEDNSEQSILKI